MKRRSLEELTTPDPLTRRFTPMGLAMDRALTAEGAVQYIQDLVSVYDLAADVPDEVKSVFERLRTVHTYGILEYDLFTVADVLGWLAFEGALRARFLLAYQSTIPFASTSAHDAVSVTSFTDVFRLVRRGGRFSAQKGWQLRSTDGHRKHANFDGSFTSLLAWARAERYLGGQRSRFVESKAIKRLRDHAAHPERFYRTTPIESSRTIDDLAEFINRLWGHRTPGGHLYPAPVERVPLVVARTLDRMTATYLLPEQLRLRDSDPEWAITRPLSEAELWEFSVVLCPKGLDILTYVLHGLNFAPLPIDLVWGPGGRDAVVDAWDRNSTAWTGDTVETIDRVFLVRYPPKATEPEWPVEYTRLPRQPTCDQRGQWLVIVADTPHDALEHAQAASTNNQHANVGSCDECRITAHGRYETFAAAVAAATSIAM